MGAKSAELGRPLYLARSQGGSVPGITGMVDVIPQ
jgi:hypothetical protein